MRHFLSFEDYSKNELLEIIRISQKIKVETQAGVLSPYLDKKVLGMIFEKSSTRTRVSFETGIYQLGGQGLFLSSKDIQLGRGEPIKDTSRVISRMVNMVMIRTFGHDRIEEFAEYSSVPVINGLTDLCHPVQILADYLTILEYLENPKPVVVYIGDGNNVANSWLMFASKMGIEIRIATPKNYEVDSGILAKSQAFAEESGSKIIISNNPDEVINDSDVVITDTWVSMGQEDDKEQKIKDFAGFKVDDEMMSKANKSAIFLHCLPAYRDLEVTESVLEGKQSAIFDEAENRLHSQKGLMVWLKNQLK
jgi:ornithine carbamoyltransferase